MMMYKPALIAGAVLGALGVVLGAFAAHGLTKVLPPEKVDVFQKGVTYQFYHCFALILAGLAYAHSPSKAMAATVPLFVLGVVLFSGSLYLYPMLEVKQVAIPVWARLLTPLGGLFFIGGWVSFLIGILNKH
jgi:uncharacterized membrane protein YgdD (TMEM256/DUF423 family)